MRIDNIYLSKRYGPSHQIPNDAFSGEGVGYHLSTGVQFQNSNILILFTFIGSHSCARGRASQDGLPAR